MLSTVTFSPPIASRPGNVPHAQQSKQQLEQGVASDTIRCNANVSLVESFRQLASDDKSDKPYRKRAYELVAHLLALSEDEIMSGKQARKMKGVGKSSAAKIDNYLIRNLPDGKDSFVVDDNSEIQEKLENMAISDDAQAKVGGSNRERELFTARSPHYCNSYLCRHPVLFDSTAPISVPLGQTS